MLLLAFVLVPAAAAALSYAIRSPGVRRIVLLVTAVGHTLGVGLLWLRDARNLSALGGWLRIDALGLLVLTVVSLVFLAVAVYAESYLRVDRPRGARVFVSCLVAFLGAASLVSLSHHLALLWIGMEATTLAVAPLVFHRHDRRSLEAVWKYLVLSSVGIGLALFGTFFLAAAQSSGRPLVLDDLIRHADTLQPGLLRAAFVFLLVGYGTKMGLAPLHSWKPDTYGEAPTLVAGLMAGALTSCAFLGLARITEVMSAAGQADFMRPPLLAFGILSLVVSAGFIIGQTDLKRLLAYSSVEHMGILVLALGIGGVGSYGAGLHLINNALAKGLVFLTVGNVVLIYQTSEASAIRGVLRCAPWSGSLLVAGLFAVTGSPPFGLFASEITILGGAIQGGHLWVVVAMVVLLAIIFLGMAKMILGLIHGEPAGAVRRAPERVSLLAGPIVLGLLVLLLGFYVPEPLHAVLREAARALGGQAP